MVWEQCFRRMMALTMAMMMMMAVMPEGNSSMSAGQRKSESGFPSFSRATSDCAKIKGITGNQLFLAPKLRYNLIDTQAQVHTVKSYIIGVKGGLAKDKTFYGIFWGGNLPLPLA